MRPFAFYCNYLRHVISNVASYSDVRGAAQKKADLVIAQEEYAT